MKLQKISLILIFLFNQLLPVYAAFDIQPVKLFKDGNICINRASNGTISTEALQLSSIVTNSESAKSRLGSSGSFCSMPPFFSGGAKLTTTNSITTQAEPVVQSLGRGILISEVGGDLGGVSSSGEPLGFNSFFMTLGTTVSTTIFEVALPIECDVIDDDNDIVGTGADLSLINDFSIHTCDATTGISVVCNAESGLLTAANGLEPASSGQPAKIRFVLSAVGTTADLNMIDSVLLKFNSQDIFCPSSVMGSIAATITAKNAVNNANLTTTVGTVDLGTLTQAGEITYISETATSTQGETSTNQIGTTPLLVGGGSTAHKIEIKELHEDSIPIGGQSSPALINPLSSNNVEINNVNLWLIPSSIGLFASPPSSSDISFSDSSLILNGTPVIVMSNADDLDAPFGTIVIPVKKNIGGSDPSTVKTTITINNLVLSVPSEGDADGTVTLSFFEPISGAVVNTPGAVSLNNSTNTSNPRNFSAFGVSSTRALAQNAIVGGALNESTGAIQIQTNTDLNFLTQRNTELNAPQIIGFTKIISAVTSVDTSKISTTHNNSVLTVTGGKDASTPGAKVEISSNSDSVTITSTKDGSFTAKLQADFSNGVVTLNFKQIVSGTESASVSTQVLQESNELSCNETVCGCENIGCTPSINNVLSYIQSQGGLTQIVTSGGAVLNEVITSIKKALGIT